MKIQFNCVSNQFFLMHSKSEKGRPFTHRDGVAIQIQLAS
jgi:hypothetical protein